MRTRWLVTLILYYLYQELTVLAFNLEPRIPVIKIGTSGTYFGYSVAEHITLPDKRLRAVPRVLVGAPKGKSGQPGTNYTGVIFDCPLTPNQVDCQKISIDDVDPVDPNESKEDQWLGVGLRSEGIGGQIVACAHRYVRQSPSTRWGLGICYALTQHLDQDNVFDPCETKDKGLAHETYGYCQVGTSVAISADRDVILGTPGVFTWRGTIYANSLKPRSDRAWYSGPLDQASPVEKYSYLGMSVTTGKFYDNQMYFVAGAPRAGNKGQVVFFTKEKYQIAGSPLNVRASLHGELFASSFGYEVAAADLNGDKRPDLIVGAPFYYGKDAGGAIYVYMNTQVGINDNTNYTNRITGKEESRFGFSIANCSDLNRDGFEDIAVGAPYEGDGVVYIFLGSINGIVETPAQIIKAGDLPAHARSFGYSLSGGLDLDNNNYPDLVIGAYESDKVFILRARPIIHITSRVDDHYLKNINATSGCISDYYIKTTCVTFQACYTIWFNESVSSHSVLLNYGIEAETFVPEKKFSRVSFKEPVSPEKSHEIQRQLVIPSGKATHSDCRTETVYLKEKISDLLTPIKFKLTYSLVQQEPIFESRGRVLPDINRYPILNQPGAIKTFEATFQKKCGSDDICQSEIRLQARLINGTDILLGDAKTVKLRVAARNIREPAYEAHVFITYPLSLGFKKQDTESATSYTCHEPVRMANEQVINCTLGNPFEAEHGDAVITLEFDTLNVRDTDLELDFIVVANSTSVAVGEKARKVQKLRIVRKAELSLIGSVFPEQLHYRGEVRGASAMQNEDEVGPEVTHIYTVINAGPSLVSRLSVDITWPYEILSEGRDLGKWIFYLMEKPKVIGASGECFVDSRYINELSLAPSPKKSDNLTLTQLTKALETVGKPDVEDDYDDDHEHEGGDRDYGTATGEGSQSGGTKVTISKTTTVEEKETTIRREHWSSSSSGSSSSSSGSSSRSSSSGRSSSRSGSSSGERGRRKRDTQPQAEALTESNIKILDCVERSARCIHIRCQIRNLLAGQSSSATIKIEGRLWSSTFISDYADVDYVLIRSHGNMTIESVLDIKQNTDDDFAEIVSKAVPDLPQSERHGPGIPIWAIIVAVCVGLILLLLLIGCLCWVGFFKRNRPQATMTGHLEKQPDYNNSHNY